MESRYYVYVLRCTGGSLYTGITPDMKRRMRQHMGLIKGGAKYTAAHKPQAIAAVWQVGSHQAAARLECALKRLPSEKKRLLVSAPETINAFLTGPEPMEAIVCTEFRLEEICS